MVKNTKVTNVNSMLTSPFFCASVIFSTRFIPLHAHDSRQSVDCRCRVHLLVCNLLASLIIRGSPGTCYWRFYGFRVFSFESIEPRRESSKPSLPECVCGNIRFIASNRSTTGRINCLLSTQNKKRHASVHRPNQIGPAYRWPVPVGPPVHRKMIPQVRSLPGI